MTNVSAVSAASKGTTTTPVEARHQSDFITLTRKCGAKISVLKDLFKSYEQLGNSEGIDTIELKNGVIINVLSSTSDAEMVVDGYYGFGSEVSATNIDGKEMEIEVDALNNKIDLISISNKLDAKVAIEEEDEVLTDNLEVRVPYKPR